MPLPLNVNQTRDNFADIKYKRNYLKSVIAKIDYSPVLKISSDPVSNFQDGIRALFPGYEVQGMMAIEGQIKMVGGAPREETTQFPFPQHIFRSNDNSYALCLQYDALWLECSNYTTYEAFIERFNHAYQLLVNLYSPINTTRLGLRYLNLITPGQGNPLDWTGLIEPTMTQFLDNLVEDKTKLSRALTRAFYIEDDYTVSIAYGFFNSQFPGKIVEKEFLLDIDCFTKIIDTEEVPSQLNSYHAEVQRLFELCVKPNLKALMNQP